MWHNFSGNISFCGEVGKLFGTAVVCLMNIKIIFMGMVFFFFWLFFTGRSVHFIFMLITDISVGCHLAALHAVLDENYTKTRNIALIFASKIWFTE